MKKYESVHTLYLGIIAVLTALYVLVRIVLSSESFGFFNWVGFVFMGVVNAGCFKYVTVALAEGSPRDAYGYVSAQRPVRDLLCLPLPLPSSFASPPLPSTSSLLPSPPPPRSLAEELMWVNWAVMAGSLISDKFWLLYLLVVGYAVYRIGSWWMGSMQSERDQLAQADAAKAKASEKGQKPVVKYR